MSSPTTTAEKELARELNALWHVRQLFEEYGNRSGRGPRAKQLGVAPHLVNRVFARGDRTYQGIPQGPTLAAIARVIGCSPNVLLLAFAKDLHPNSTNCFGVIQTVVDQAVHMTESQRGQLVELAKALVTMTQSQGRDVVRYAKRVIADSE